MSRERIVYQTEDYKGFKIEICYDPEAENPREWDNLGTIYTRNPRHNFDNKKIEDLVIESGHNPDNFEKIPFNMFSKTHIWAKVYAYEHSGMTVRVADSNPYPDPMWDSYLLGVIAVSKERIRKEYNWKKITKARAEKILKVLTGEIDTLDCALTGQVYGFVTSKDGEEFDSCWGYYGDEGIKEALTEARSVIDSNTKE